MLFPERGSQLHLASRHPETPHFCRAGAIFLFLFPSSSSSTGPGVLKAPGALLGGLEAVSKDGKNRSLMEFDFSGSLFFFFKNVLMFQATSERAIQ